MNEILLTKTDGLPLNEWLLGLLAEAKKDGYLLDISQNRKQAEYFYNSDYSPEDAWREIFEESAPI